jgi:hypothetical protein
MESTCENCGRPDDELVLVQRAYLDGSGRVDRVEESTELWCLSCTSQYPHQAAPES